MSIFQVASTLFALFMIYVVRIHGRKVHLSRIEAFFWYSMWVLFAVIALFPDMLIGVVHVLHFSRVFDLLTVTAMMILTVIVVLSYFRQKEMMKKLEDFVREDAIKKVQ